MIFKAKHSNENLIFFFENSIKSIGLCHLFKKRQYYTAFQDKNIKSYNYKDNIIRANIEISEKWKFFLTSLNQMA